MRKTVFLSHSSRDQSAVEEIREALEGNGIGCWLAPRDIEPGADWAEAVVHGIRQCRVMVVIVSSQCADADGLLDEVNHALDCRKKIVPYKIDEVEQSRLPKGLALRIGRRQWLTGTDFGRNGHESLVSHLRRVMRKRTEEIQANQPDKPQQNKSNRPGNGEFVDSPIEQSAFVNPYRFDLAPSSLTFKGRDAELDELMDSIATGTHTAIFGLQRMGKTSLMDRGLPSRLRQRPKINQSVMIAKVDLQMLSDLELTYRDFLTAIVKSLTDSCVSLGLALDIDNLRALTHELFAAGRFARGDRTEMFSVFTNLIRQFSKVTRRRLILFIDEFSEVRRVIERSKLLQAKKPDRIRTLLPQDMLVDVPFLHHLSALLKDADNKEVFTLIVAVRPFMAEFDARENLQILKLMKPLTVYHLDEHAAKSLILDPLEGLVTYDDGVVDYLYQLTAGHPYLIQFMLNHIVSVMIRERRSRLRMDDVVRMENRMTCEGPQYDAHFHTLVSDYSVDEVRHPEEARLGNGTLAIVSKFAEHQSDRWVAQGQIVDELAKYRVPNTKAMSLLAQLKRTRIFDEQMRDGRLCFRIAVPLLQKRFLQQNIYEKWFG